MWRVINHGHGVDVYVGGVKCYLAPNSVTRTKNKALVEAARKVPAVKIIEEMNAPSVLNGLSIGKLRKLASRGGIKNYSRFNKKELIKELKRGENR